jgi:hypothetical protein
VKKLLIAAVSVIAVLLWRHQRSELKILQIRNERLAASAQVLIDRAQSAQSARHSLEEKLAGLRTELRALPANSESAGENSATRLPNPDPVHKGGWPAGADFIYLPKQYLTNAGYQLLNGGHLTDEAAALLGMSPADREAADKTFGDLLDQFHRLEIQRMQPVGPPTGWPVGSAGSTAPGAISFDSALVYHVPDLSADISTAQATFQAALQQNLGASRADIISSAADSYLRQNLSDLGAGDRLVGFLWQAESDGTKSLWYGVADDRNGEGSFERVGQNLDLNSPIAYYAQLFGVKLPGQ